MNGYLLHELHWIYSTGCRGHGHRRGTVVVNKKNAKTQKPEVLGQLASIHCTGTMVMIVVVAIIMVLCCRCKQKKRSKLLTCWVDPDTLDWRSWGCWWLLVLSSSLQHCAAVVNKKKKNTYLLGWPRYAGSAELGVLVAISVDLRRY